MLLDQHADRCCKVRQWCRRTSRTGAVLALCPAYGVQGRTLCLPWLGALIGLHRKQSRHRAHLCANPCSLLCCADAV